MHVVTFNVFDVHRKGFPDGEYPVKSELTGDREESNLRLAIGFKRIEPLAYYGGALRKDQHLVSLDFAVVLEPPGAGREERGQSHAHLPSSNDQGKGTRESPGALRYVP